MASRQHRPHAFLCAPMRWTARITGLVLLACPILSAAQKNDTIRLFNGDRVVAEMKDLKLGLLRLSTDYMSTVYIEWDQIQTVRTTKRWYIRLKSGAYYDGYLAASPMLDHLYILTDGDSIHVNLTDITTLYRLNKGIWPRTDGALNAGYSYQKSNELSQLSLSGNATYRADKGAVNLAFNWITSTQPEVAETRKQDVSLGGERNLWGRWTTGVTVGAESNTELDLDLRLRAAASVGNYLLLATHASNLLGGGVQGNIEKSGTGVDSENYEVFVGDRLRIKTYRFPELSVYLDIAGYYGLTIEDRYRLSGEIEVQYEVFKDFTVGLEFYEQYDSRPLDGGPSLNDYRMAATIGYTF